VLLLQPVLDDFLSASTTSQRSAFEGLQMTAYRRATSCCDLIAITYWDSAISWDLVATDVCDLVATHEQGGAKYYCLAS
jgi:hypothetical protein